MRQARFSTLVTSICLAALLVPQPRSARADGDTPAIVADTGQLDAAREFAGRAQGVAATWYPKIVAILGEGPEHPPETVKIVMDLNYDGVAATSGSTIHIAPKWIHNHPDDIGMVVHELTHVVQAYPKYDPVWLVEGIADYVRFFNFEPVSARPHPNPDRASYHDSYRTTAAFLDWATRTYDRELIHKLNHALHTSTYTDDLFKQATGKDVQTLNSEWLQSLRDERR